MTGEEVNNSRCFSLCSVSSNYLIARILPELTQVADEWMKRERDEELRWEDEEVVKDKKKNYREKYDTVEISILFLLGDRHKHFKCIIEI